MTVTDRLGDSPDTSVGDAARIPGTILETGIKEAVRVATTTNIALSGAQTIDGVAIVAGDRVLAKDQTDGVENGVYVAATGAWARALDYKGSYDVATGTMVLTTEGTLQANRLYHITTLGDITVGTTALAYDYLVVTALPAKLQALVNLTWAENKLLHLTGTETVELLTTTGVGRALISALDDAAGRSTLGLGAVSLLDFPDDDDLSETADGIDQLPARRSNVDAAITTAIAAIPTGFSLSDLPTVAAGDAVKVSRSAADLPSALSRTIYMSAGIYQTGAVRLKFSGGVGGSSTVAARIYVNGVAVAGSASYVSSWSISHDLTITGPVFIEFRASASGPNENNITGASICTDGEYILPFGGEGINTVAGAT